MRRTFLFACLLCLFSICSISSHATDAFGPSDSKNPTYSVGEVIQNGSFEEDTNSDGAPDFWRIASPGGRDCTEAFSGNCSLVLPGGPLRKAKQKIAVAGIATDVYSFNSWWKISGATNYQIIFVKVRFKCNDGTVYVRNFSFRPNRSLDWFEVGFPVTATCDYSSIVVYLWHHASSGGAWFDDLSLDSESDSNDKDNAVAPNGPTEIEQE